MKVFHLGVLPHVHGMVQISVLSILLLISYLYTYFMSIPSCHTTSKALDASNIVVYKMVLLSLASAIASFNKKAEFIDDE